MRVIVVRSAGTLGPSHASACGGPDPHLSYVRPPPAGFTHAAAICEGPREVLADRVEEAGLELCERERCPIEAGRCLQGLAEVTERRGEREQAMEYLDRAGELFSRHGAKLYLDQVLAKKEILKA